MSKSLNQKLLHQLIFSYIILLGLTWSLFSTLLCIIEAYGVWLDVNLRAAGSSRRAPFGLQRFAGCCTKLVPFVSQYFKKNYQIRD